MYDGGDALQLVRLSAFALVVVDCSKMSSLRPGGTGSTIRLGTCRCGCLHAACFRMTAADDWTVVSSRSPPGLRGLCYCRPARFSSLFPSSITRGQGPMAI